MYALFINLQRSGFVITIRSIITEANERLTHSQARQNAIHFAFANLAMLNTIPAIGINVLGMPI